MALSQKAIRIFSAVEVLREGNADIRHALAALFQPVLSTFDQEVYDPAKLAKAVNEQYKLGVNRDVMEEFAPVFEHAGWIKKISGSTPRVAYLVCSPSDQEADRQTGAFSKEAQELADEFRKFIRAISPLSQIQKSNEELIDGLIDWMMQLDGLSEQDMKSASSVQRFGHRLVYEFSPPAEFPMGDEAFLSARFVQHLFETESPHIQFLTELAGVGLLTEVVRDFYKPSSRVKKTDVTLYLDAPVLLDYLGLSGRVEQDNIRAMLAKVAEIGGTLRTFRASVVEAESALSAVLARPMSARQGPTADALRRGEVLEPFVRGVSQNADKYIAAAGIGIVDQSLDQFPHEHKFFEKSLIEDMYSQISWVKDDAPRWHDSSITALIMRKRAGTRSADLFETKHLIVTRNPFFPVLARRIAASASLIGPKHIGPAVHQRQLATAIWLRAGAGLEASDIPRRYILASCRRVLTLRKNIVQKVQQLIGGLSTQQAEQLELLMSEDRSTQVLMDRTLGSAAVIDSTNIPILLEDMKRAAIQEVHEAADQKVAEIRSSARKKEGELKAKVEEEQSRQSELHRELSEASGKYFGAVKASLARINGRIRNRRIILSVSSLLLLLALEVGSYFISGNTNVTGLLLLATLVGVVILGHFKDQISDWILDPMLKGIDHRTFDKICRNSGLDSEEIAQLVFYEDGKFILK